MSIPQSPKPDDPFTQGSAPPPMAAISEKNAGGSTEIEEKIAELEILLKQHADAMTKALAGQILALSHKTEQ